MLDEFDQLLKTPPMGQGAQGLSLFDDLLQTEPLSLNFNRKSAPWESSTVAQQANSVRMSPNEIYATGQFDPKPQNVPKATDPSFLEKAAAVAEPYSPLTGLLDPSNQVIQRSTPSPSSPTDSTSTEINRSASTISNCLTTQRNSYRFPSLSAYPFGS